jgi:uncharacterized protein YegJ (DUF2314 family)
MIFCKSNLHQGSESNDRTVKHYLGYILAGALLVGAAIPARADHAVAREDLKPSAEPQVFNVGQHNHAMRQAVHQARRTVGVFIQALQKPGPGQSDFEVKKYFVQNGAVEHLWLADVTFSGNRFHGYVDNRPVIIKGLKMGDRVSVDPDEISDWAFVDHGRLIGGYTIRVLYSELSPAGRVALQKEARFTISNRN